MTKTRYAWSVGIAVTALVAATTAVRSGEADRPIDPDWIPAAAREEINSVVREIDRIEAEALNRARSLATADRFEQITLLGKIIFYDQELSVMRNESCAFCHMPEAGFSGRSALSTRPPWPTQVPFGIASAHESLNLTPTRASHRCFTTIRNKAILSEANSGTCAPRGCVWTARWPSRHKVLR